MESLPCFALSFVSSWSAVFYVRYLHLLNLITSHEQVNYWMQVKLSSPTLTAVVGSLCSWVALGSPRCLVLKQSPWNWVCHKWIFPAFSAKRD